MENGNPIEQIKGFAEKKLHALRENPDESGTRAYLAKMRKGVGKVPGADPELWGILFEDLPEELTGRGIHLDGQKWHCMRRLHCMQSTSKVAL